MKLYAPKYYKRFSCIADKCSHSCCIGWEIDIDSKTLSKYKALSHTYADSILSGIENLPSPHFRLDAGDRCPHLNGKGLCNIILNVGEEFLCDICREHPRFYNVTNDGKEVGLGMACEEACRLILNSDDYNTFAEIGEMCGEPELLAFDSRIHRNKIYSVLADDAVSYNDKLKHIYIEYNISPSAVSDNEWQDIISSLEYLDKSHLSLFSKYSSVFSDVSKYEKQLERALAYFVFRHCTESVDEDEFRISLGFCLFCERLLASLIMSENVTDINGVIRLARIISEEIEYSEDNTDSIKFELSLI